MANRHSGRRIFSYAIVAICLIKLLVLWLAYAQLEYNLRNPLIPRQLLEWKFNYSLALTAVYLPVIALNLFYLLKNKMFWPIAVISVAGMGIIQLFWFQISQYFLPG